MFVAEGIAITTSYFPTTEAARLAWVMHYRDMIAVHGPTLGLSAEEIANTQRELDFYIWIESRINNGEWVALGADNSKPHYDTRPLIDPATPEVREYRLRWWDKGVPNGEFSPIQKIVVVG